MQFPSSFQATSKPPVRSPLRSQFGSSRGKRFRPDVPKIWMIEDDRADRLIGHQYISRNFPGIDLRFFETARDLSSALKTHQFPSVLVMDLGLPDADGLVLLSEVNELRKTSGLIDRHIIVLTGRDMVEVEAKCREFGAMAVLSKYACLENYDHLVSCIEIALRRKRG